MDYRFCQASWALQVGPGKLGLALIALNVRGIKCKLVSDTKKAYVTVAGKWYVIFSSVVLTQITDPAISPGQKW